MNEDAFNMSMRKFLKQVGVTSQQQIEQAVRAAAPTGPDNVRLIQMCDDCRIRSQYHSEGQPFAAGERPRPRTTEDYLAERKTGRTNGEDAD